jgi:hypothetical protein
MGSPRGRGTDSGGSAAAPGGGGSGHGLQQRPAHAGSQEGHWQKKKTKKQGAEESVQSKEARQAADICLPHWRYSASARFCNNP